MDPLRRAGSVALTIGAVLGALCLVLTLAAVVLDVRPLFVRSGSMAPAIETGSLALARTTPAADLEVGDVVSVTTATGSRVTHRVVSLEPSAGTTRLTLQGDANTVPDSETYVVEEAERVFLDVPYVGYAVGWLRGTTGLVVLAGLVVLLLLLIGRGGGSSGGAGRRRAEQTRPTRRRRRALVVTMAVGMVALGPASPSWAAPWTDSVAMGGTTLTADTVVAPVVSCSALTVGAVTLNWTAVPGATSYRIHYGASGSDTSDVAPTVTSKVFSGLATSGRFFVEARRNFGSVTWESVTSNKMNYSILLFLVSTCTNA